MTYEPIELDEVRAILQRAFALVATITGRDNNCSAAAVSAIAVALEAINVARAVVTAEANGARNPLPVIRSIPIARRPD
jgi:hypothetical protein